MQLRRSLIATGAVAVLAVSGVTAAVANDPPPRIAFLANGIVPADALAAGPIAGQLGAPIYTTGPGSLIESTGVALDAYDPDLVIVMGGPAAISDEVLAQVSDVTGLSVEEASPPPTSGIVRAAGQDRFETAAAAAALLGSYDPAFLPTDMQAADSDKLDGKDSSEFALKSDLGTGGGDADTLDGKDSTDFLPADGKAQAADHADTAGDADTLDGKDSSSFALSDQSCVTGEVVTGIAEDGTPTCAPDQIDGGDADTLDGAHASDFQAAGDYLGANETAQNSTRLGGYGSNEYMRTDGSRAMDDTISYSQPQERTAFVGSREFVSSGDVQYVGTGARGDGTHAIQASLDLPDGAVITSLKAFGSDGHASVDLEVTLTSSWHGSNSVFDMAEVVSSGDAGSFELTDASVSSSTVDLHEKEYWIQAGPAVYGDSWNGYLSFSGALVTYTVTEEH